MSKTKGNLIEVLSGVISGVLSASVAGPYRKATQPTPEVGSNARHIEL